MCVYNIGPIEIATTEMRAFKVVARKDDGSFTSQFRPDQRTPQYRLSKTGQKIPARDPGVEVTYQLGETTRSDMEVTSGLYVFVECPHALIWANKHEHVLEVGIPLGTRYRTAELESGSRTLLVEELIPVRVVQRNEFGCA